MIISQTAFAVAPGISASFLASGGVAPYLYALIDENAAGGSIVQATGKYSAPVVWNSNPRNTFDTIEVTDANGEKATAKIQVGPPLKLFMEILQRELSLPADRVILFNQKIEQPKDAGIYIAVSVLNSKVFGNTNRPTESGGIFISEQYISVADTIGVDIFSVDNSALFRKEDVLLALGSNYAERQQNTNSFQISKIPRGLANISGVDGTHIPYRFHFDLVIQYAYKKSSNIDYYDTFEQVSIVTNP